MEKATQLRVNKWRKTEFIYLTKAYQLIIRNDRRIILNGDGSMERAKVETISRYGIKWKTEILGKEIRGFIPFEDMTITGNGL